jgi:hypothetical protein
MTEGSSSSAGPDLTQGVPLASIVDGEIVTGHVDGEPALLVHQGGRLLPSVLCARIMGRRWPTAFW